MRQTFSLDGTAYGIDDLDGLLTDIDFIRNNKGVCYGNVSCAFDIETTSIEINGIKNAVMYAFVFGFNGHTVIGCTWSEAMAIFNKVSQHYGLNQSNIIVCYVHNLSYEFQFFRKRFEWESVFSVAEREPVKALTDIGIEFRDSYILSGYSLATVGKNLLKYRVQKMTGDLDYSLPRGSKTALTDRELGYVKNDGLVVMAFIQEKIEHDGDITKIPLTKTGYVRNLCRKNCLYARENGKRDINKWRSYRSLMLGLPIQDLDEYAELKRAFQGGFTHANSFMSGKTIEDVTSYDFTSSYPSVLIDEKYPCNKGSRIILKNDEDLFYYMKRYCCLFDVDFTVLCSVRLWEHPISMSKCYNVKDPEIDNGRIISASALSTTLTEQDFYIIKEYYSFKSFHVRNLIIYEKSYLPTAFVETVLSLYKSKTTLKGVSGKEEEYLNGKEQLNACYGMCVTDIIKDETTYEDGEWSSEPKDRQEALDRYNKSKSRFLCYQWGIWITAYARRNLFSGITELADDYIYSDTDSIKGRNIERHLPYIKKYNDAVLVKLEDAMNYHGLSIDECRPKTVKGVEKLIGVWDFDGHYQKFKTLGAKRYLTLNDSNEYSMTVSGLNKKIAMPYLKSKADEEHKEPFDLFEDGLYFPPSATGKNTHYYLDYEQNGSFMDYNKEEQSFSEMSGVYLEEAPYSLSLSEEYLNLLMGYREEHYL